MEISFGSACHLHKSYGHKTFVQEAKKASKSITFIQNVCVNEKCKENKR